MRATVRANVVFVVTVIDAAMMICHSNGKSYITIHTIRLWAVPLLQLNAIATVSIMTSSGCMFATISTIENDMGQTSAIWQVLWW